MYCEYREINLIQYTTRLSEKVHYWIYSRNTHWKGKSRKLEEEKSDPIALYIFFY